MKTIIDNRLNKTQKVLLIVNGVVMVVASATVGLLTAVMVQRLIEAGYVISLPLAPIL